MFTSISNVSFRLTQYQNNIYDTNINIDHAFLLICLKRDKFVKIIFACYRKCLGDARSEHLAQLYMLLLLVWLLCLQTKICV